MYLIILNRSTLRLCGAIIMTVTFILIAIFFLFPHQRTTAPLAQINIVIDPGHGGVDGGTRDDTGHLEKDINLTVGLKLRDQLRQSGLNVLMTRESDTDLSPFITGRKGRHRRDLLARVETAKKSKALFLVSIHCDWSKARSRQGVVAFYNYRNANSKALAQSIQEEVNKVQKKPQKAAPGKYFIIRQQGITGVLVEVGFLSNSEEAALLQQPEYQDKLAMAIASGILKYLKKGSNINSGDNQFVDEQEVLLPQCPAEVAD